MPTRTTTPGARLRALAETELRQLGRELASARRGKDGGVHRSRKALQRLRALVRLLAPCDVEWARREDALLCRLRRRLGRLRDAAVRLELVEGLVERELASADRERLDAALEQIRRARHAIWEAHPPELPFWDLLEKESVRLRGRLARWPFEAVNQKRIEQAVERARLRLRRALKNALGRVERNHRHDLRRRLRRFGALRTASAKALRRRDVGAVTLVDLAREMGSEGDLWLAAAALRSCGHAHETRGLRRILEAERRALCKRHDGELAAARRRLLEKPVRPGPKRSARVAPLPAVQSSADEPAADGIAA